MKLSLIVAMDKNGLIGKQGGLPWPRINEDMDHFRKLTWDKSVIVGRTTWSTLPFLPRRKIVLLSSNPVLAMSLWDACSFPEQAIHKLAGCDTAFVIGGAQTYAAFAGLYTSAHVTLIDGEFDGDTYFPFPILDSPDWGPAAEPVTLAPGVVYHHMRRAVLTIHSASHLLALAHGRDCAGDGRCFYCGAPADGSLSTRDHVKDTFTGWAGAAVPGSDRVCEGCVLSMIDTADVPYIDGTIKHMPRAATRMNSWVITATSALAANKSHIDHLRRVCLDPPPPPYAIVVSESGQTHQIYRASVGRSFDFAVANIESVPVAYDPKDIAELLDVAGRLAACVGKPGITEASQTGRFGVALAARMFERYTPDRAESLISTWLRRGGSPLGRLVAYLTPKMEDCKSAYPSDLD